jgi:uncharacterized protein YgbK (DUF1537 family)
MTSLFRVLIVADDLTGAMDSASPFAARGMSTWVLTQADAVADVADAQVLSVNTESRHLPAEQAAQRVVAVWKRFGADRPVLVKKIDSTLRGQVMAETRALLRATGRMQAIVAPAFPAQGRSVKAGVVHVNGVPLAQTGFARDALAPPPLVPLQSLFSQEGMLARVTSPRGPFDGGGVFVPDTTAETDLEVTVDSVRASLDQTLLVGSGGLTRAVATCMGASGAVAGRDSVAGCILFVVGSRAAQTAAQIDALRALEGTVVMDLPAGQPGSLSWPAGTRQLVLLAPRETGDAAQVAKDLARCALTVRDAGDFRAMVATGGDTAVAVLEAAGCRALHVLGDLLPGIPFSTFAVHGQACWIVTKAGGFGNDNTLRDVVRLLRHANQPA